MSLSTREIAWFSYFYTRKVPNEIMEMFNCEKEKNSSKTLDMLIDIYIIEDAFEYERDFALLMMTFNCSVSLFYLMSTNK